MEAKEYLKRTNPNIGIRLQELNISGNVETIMESYLTHETPRIKAKAREEFIDRLKGKFTDEWCDGVTNILSSSNKYSKDVIDTVRTISKAMRDQILNHLASEP